MAQPPLEPTERHRWIRWLVSLFIWWRLCSTDAAMKSSI